MDWARARYNMVEGQLRPNRVTDPRIIAAMAEIPREALVPPARQALAYADAAVPVAPGRALLAPMVLGRLLQEAAPRAGARALCLPGRAACGALVLARLGCRVTVLETPEQADAAAAALAAAGLALAPVRGALEAGWAAAAPYDLILVEAGLARVPAALTAQLAEGGQLLAIVGEETPRRAVRIDRLGGSLSERALFDAAAPLLPGIGAAPAFSL